MEGMGTIAFGGTLWHLAWNLKHVYTLKSFCANRNIPPLHPLTLPLATGGVYDFHFDLTSSRLSEIK